MRKPMIRSTSDVWETAGAWALKSELGLEPREQARLETWLDAEPSHRAAYEAVFDLGRTLDHYSADEVIRTMRDAALKARPRYEMSSRKMAVGVVAGMLATGFVAWWGNAHLSDLSGAIPAPQQRTGLFATAVGERATVSLADGSVVTLNTDSAVEVTLDSRARIVRLVRGQALFAVAHDTARPFEVLVGGRRVSDVGTVFDVLLLSDEVRVAMLDGVARVSSDRDASAETLSKGEVLTARRDGAVTVRNTDTARLAAWRDGEVYFDATPLDDAVAEMNRYARHPIKVADAKTASLRVSGAFRTAEADTFAETMGDLFSLPVKTAPDGRSRVIGSS
jgi:transmembrane sensor